MGTFLLATLVTFRVSQGAGLVVPGEPLLVFNSTGPVAEIQVTNNADQAVTAWQLAIDVTVSDGRVTTQMIAPDAYVSYTRNDSVDGRFVRAHGSYRASIPLGIPIGLTISRIHSTMKWAIFADGSWVGDAAEVQRVFRRRESDMRTFATIIQALRAGVAAGSGREVVKVALNRLDASGSEDTGDPYIRVMRRNLEMALQGRFNLPEVELLRRWILDTEGRWTAADQHRHQRAERANPMTRH